MNRTLENAILWKCPKEQEQLTEYSSKANPKGGPEHNFKLIKKSMSMQELPSEIFLKL